MTSSAIDARGGGRFSLTPSLLLLRAARFLPAVGLGAAVSFLYFPALVALVHQWSTDENYSHGFLIPLISAYLIWDRRHQVRRCRTRVSIWGYVALVLGLALLIIGQAATFGFAVRLSLLVVLAALVLFLVGPDVLRVLTFPLAYLLFMVPLPAPILNQIAFPLQLMAAKLATGTLDVMNIPVFREGNIIDLASVRLEVTEACSGIRSLVSLLALAVIFAYLTQKTWGPRLAVALSAIPIALVTNAARVTLTGVLVAAISPQMAMGFYHAFSGLLIFVLAFGLLTTEGLLFSWLGKSTART